MCTAGTEARGFTLLELLVVLLIASLAVSLVGPAFQRLMPGLQLEAETRELMALLRHARSQAILSGRRVELSQEGQGGALRLSYRERPHAPPRGLTLTLSGSVDTLASPADAGGGTASGAQILFFPQGDSSGGSLAVAAEDGRSTLIKVDGLSGRVQRTTVEDEERLKEEREAQKAKALKQRKQHPVMPKGSSFGRQEQADEPT